MRFVVCISLLAAGCVSPNVWVISRSENGGAIGYQNYNPSSDGNRLINQLIHCRPHKMVWNGMRSQATGASGYYMSGNIAVPLDDGVIRWMEYHYKCTIDITTPTQSVSSCEDRCKLQIEHGTEEDIKECLNKSCGPFHFRHCPM